MFIQKNTVYLQFIVHFLWLMLANINYLQADTANICFKDNHLKSTSNKNLISKFCKGYLNLDYRLGEIINNQNLFQNYTRYSSKLATIKADITSVSKISDIIRRDRDIQKSPLTHKSFKLMVNKLIRNFYLATYAISRAQQQKLDVGSFLIGNEGYLNQIGTASFFGLEEIGNRTEGIKLKIVPAINSPRDIANGSCQNSYAVSFITQSSISDFFTDNELVLTVRGNVIEQVSKNRLFSSADRYAAFCIDRQGDGFRIRTSGDDFIGVNNSVTTRNINSSGTFVFTSSKKVIPSKPINTEYFRQGFSGYLKQLNLFKKNDNENNAKEDYVYSKIKYKLIDPVYKFDDVDTCSPDSSFSFKVDSEDVLQQVLSSNYSKLVHVFIQELDTDFSKKSASFCLEKDENGFRIKDFFGNYITLDDSDLKDSTGALTRNINKSGVFHFASSMVSKDINNVNDTRNLTLGVRGQLKTHDANNIEKYIEEFALDKNTIEHGIIQHSINNILKIEGSGVERNSVITPLTIKLIEPIYPEIKDYCVDGSLPVSLEVVNNSGFVLARDGWQFTKHDKLTQKKNLDSIFCIEKDGDKFYLRTLSNYYIDNQALGFTKNPSQYGKYSLVNSFDDITNQESVNTGNKFNTEYGYLKNTNGNLFFTTKNIDNIYFDTAIIRFANYTNKDMNVCTKPNTTSVKLYKQGTYQLLTNYYGRLTFMNSNLNLSDLFTTFCFERQEKGYKIYSNLYGNSQYISKNGYQLTTDINQTAVYEIDEQVDIADTNIIYPYTTGYFKLVDRNIYFNVEDVLRRDRADEHIPLRVKLKNKNTEAGWCRDGYLYTFQDDNTSSLFVQASEIKLGLQNIESGNIKDDTTPGVCLVPASNPFVYFIKLSPGAYVSNADASSIVSGLENAGKFVFSFNRFSDGISQDALFDKFHGFTLRFSEEISDNYLGAANSLSLFWARNFNNTLNFELEPGLAEQNCYSFKVNKSNNYLIFDNNQILVAGYTNEEVYKYRATFCPIIDIVNNKAALYPISYSNLYLGKSGDVPAFFATNGNFNLSRVPYVSIVNKREIFTLPRDLIENNGGLVCNDLAENARRVDTMDETINGVCPSLDSLRISEQLTKDDYQLYEYCCSGIAQKFARATYPIDSNRRCRIQYDLICVADSVVS